MADNALKEAGSPAPSLPQFKAPYAEPDEPLVARIIGETAVDAATDARIDRIATRLIEEIRERAGAIGGVEDFLREYGLSTREGLALMVLAEALLRVPDGETADRLIEDKLGAADWSEKKGGDTWLVSASTWALGLTARIVHPGETPEGIIAGTIKRLGLPTVRTATRQAMRVLGHHFVLGETIEGALSRARGMAGKGYRHSFDMLGEGARTHEDARRYFESYARAIEAIGKKATGRGADRPGISVKLSALHPRYEAVNREAVLAELVPAVTALARAARKHDLNFTVDAEEADRLEISLEVIALVAADPELAGWDGFGLAIQAYQKRVLAVVDWVIALARALDRRFMVRLVKGAYWDTEVKRAQERGLPDYPVLTRKAATDAAYIAAARRLLGARERIYSQFATHNALTVATIQALAGDGSGYEFQRLHGMGEALYEALAEGEQPVPCRIYAPVGGHRDLLAYLVRRLLENGANSSFVAIVGDRSVPIAELLQRPDLMLDGGRAARHRRIPLPVNLYGGARRNSMGLEFGAREMLEPFAAAIAATPLPFPAAAAIIEGKAGGGTPRAVVSPVDGKTVAGSVSEATPEIADKAIAAAAAGFAGWSRTPVEARAAALEKMADLLEANRDRLIAMMAVEAGKTLADGIAEVREAADFCRYYAREARRQFGEDEILAGPTGEENRLRRRGRGVFVCISPWNFPLAIFLGQVSAALVAGNTVVAKPAEQTPLVAAEAIRLLHSAGVPAGALQFVPGDGAVGARLVGHEKVAGVAFTGSTEVAWKINRTLAAKNGPIVPLIAETGGINAMIVDATALPEQVADDVVTSAFRSAGQRCSALRLLFVQEDVADRMLEMIAGAAAELRLGDPRRPSTDMGPVIDAEAKEKLDSHIGRMTRQHKTVHAGTVPNPAAGGTFVAPHIFLLGKASDLGEEIFGPILHVVRWKAGKLKETIAAVEATGYGLTLGVHSRIDQTVKDVVDAVAVGNCYVNRNMIGAVVGVQPFGGSGLSGTGPKAGGPGYLARFAEEQVISTNTAAAGGNASLIAMSDD